MGWVSSLGARAWSIAAAAGFSYSAARVLDGGGQQGLDQLRRQPAHHGTGHAVAGQVQGVGDPRGQAVVLRQAHQPRRLPPREQARPHPALVDDEDDLARRPPPAGVRRHPARPSNRASAPLHPAPGLHPHPAEHRADAALARGRAWSSRARCGGAIWATRRSVCASDSQASAVSSSTSARPVLRRAGMAGRHHSQDACRSAGRPAWALRIAGPWKAGASPSSAGGGGVRVARDEQARPRLGA